MINILVVQRAI